MYDLRGAQTCLLAFGAIRSKSTLDTVMNTGTVRLKDDQGKLVSVVVHALRCGAYCSSVVPWCYHGGVLR